MVEVIIAVGSNLGDRLSYIQKAGRHLEKLSNKTIEKASIWESEPVGGAKYSFLNTAARIYTNLEPQELLNNLKNFEQICGREKNPERWGPRVIDLDIISYGNLVIEQESLIIPHPEFSKRRFVLNPMLEINSDWCEPRSGLDIKQIQQNAPSIEIYRTEYSW